jgi:hypothetical protein
MDDPVLDQVLGQLSKHDLNRARASSERAGDQDLVAKIDQRLQDRDSHPAHAGPPLPR